MLMSSWTNFQPQQFILCNLRYAMESIAEEVVICNYWIDYSTYDIQFHVFFYYEKLSAAPVLGLSVALFVSGCISLEIECITNVQPVDTNETAIVCDSAHTF